MHLKNKIILILLLLPLSAIAEEKIDNEETPASSEQEIK